VLVIDDEAGMRDSCAQVLERDGMEVLSASDGRTALELITRRLPEVVIIDLKMPGMSGGELLINALEVDPDLVAVVITGYPSLSSAVDAMKAGAYDFLPKPFKAEELRIITRRAVEKRKLSVAAAAAEREKSRMRDNFAAMVAHQLKSPLTTLKECLDASAFSFSEDIPQHCKELILRASRKADFLLDLMNDWLTLARMESAGMRAGGTPVDVAAVVQRSISAAQECLQCHDVALEYEQVGRPPCVQGDAEALRELFVNIVENALRYTPDGGQAHVQVAAEGGGVSVTVADNGQGIPAEDLGLIFEPFYRGKESKRTGGTGLGLAIAKQIAEAHRGHISVQSEVGKGTTLRVFLPGAEEDR